MPLYEFKTKDGRILTKKCPATGPGYPEVGTDHQVFDEMGRVVQATRVMSVPQRPTQVWKPYISSRLPRHMKGQPCAIDGKVIVNTQAQEREIMAQGGFERE